MKKMLIIDGNSILNRAYYGIRPLTNKDGLFTHAVYGMTNILLRQLDSIKPDFAAVAFDLPSPTFRHLEYTQYKANRHGMPEELAMQLPYAKKCCSALGFTVVEKAGFEADDILGTFSEMSKTYPMCIDQDERTEAFLLTGDRDSLQLISDTVTVLLATNAETVNFDRDKFRETYGIEPEQFVSVKALMGDSSDNIPGVAGVGEKTALKLIKDFGSLDGIYKYLDGGELPEGASAPSKGVVAKLTDGRDSAYMSLRLATIVRNADIGYNVSDISYSGFTSELYPLFIKLEFTTLIKKLGLTGSEIKPDNERNAPAPIDDGSSLTALPESGAAPTSEKSGRKLCEIPLKKLDNDTFSGDTVAVEIDFNDNIIFISDAENDYFCRYDGVSALIPFFTKLKKQLVVYDIKSMLNYFRGNTEFAAALRDTAFYKTDAFYLNGSPVTLVPDLKANIHGAKPDADSSGETGSGSLAAGKLFDISLAAYILTPTDSGYLLDQLTARYLAKQFAQIDISELCGDSSSNDTSKDNTSAAKSGKATPFFGARPLFELYPVLYSEIAKNCQQYLYYGIELPTARVLSEMEAFGFKVDISGLNGFSQKLDILTSSYASEIYELAGCTFNINSPKQLGEVLFDKLSLPVLKKKKTGYTTNAETLEKLRPYYPIVNLVLEYRQVTKLNSTYAVGLAKTAGYDGRIHTSFNQTITATGRLSSTEPNLQNIPIRQPLGRELRRFFIPQSDEYLLIDADYSQIELRLLAAISGDETMIEAFKNGIDIHSVTASQVFRVPLEAVTPEQRKRAKAVNFGIVYGIGEFSLAQDINVSKFEAGEYIKSYFEKYPAVKKYMTDIVKRAKEDGYVSTLFGRRRYIPELTSQKAALRSFGERVAMNSPIQGSAADIIKLAMVNTAAALKEAGIDAKLILQVHDELIVEANRSCADKASEILKREMEDVASLGVPLTVDISTGSTWFDS